MLATTVPDFLTFLANTAIIRAVALIVWFLIVAAGVWLGEKAVEKFLSRTATRPETSAPGSGATGAPTPARTVVGAFRRASLHTIFRRCSDRGEAREQSASMGITP